MRCAYNLTRREVHYRHAAFTAGLRAAGFEVRYAEPVGRPGDVLLVWNRYGQYHDTATRFERAGGTVIVAENGYLGRDETGNQLYALAVGGHNGTGRWNVGAPERFDALGVTLAPWRESGDKSAKVVIRGQRGIGQPGVASPPDWFRDVAARLKRLTNRPLQFVPHPGQGAEACRKHEEYLRGAHALVIWGSGVGVKALALGVPVFHELPGWICAGAARFGLADLENPLLDDAARLDAMRRMAWAQWRLSEIESGAAFKALLA